MRISQPLYRHDHMCFGSQLHCYGHFWGVRDLGLEHVGRCGSTKKAKNLARNLYHQVVKDKRTIPVEISMVDIRLRVQKPKVREIVMPYPVIFLSSWVSYLLQWCPKYVLGGFDLGQHAQFTALFGSFWRRYKAVDPLHPVYNFFSESEYGNIVPWSFHGDEGRGLAKVPLLVCAFQFLYSWKGEQKTNIAGFLASFWQSVDLFFATPNLRHRMYSWFLIAGFGLRIQQLRHSFGARFASTFISAKMYAKHDATYYDYHEAIAADCDGLFFDGLTVETPRVSWTMLGIQVKPGWCVYDCFCSPHFGAKCLTDLR